MREKEKFGMGFTSCLERELAFSKIPGSDRKTLPRSSLFHLDYSSFVSDVAVWFFCLYNNLAESSETQIPIIPSTPVFFKFYTLLHPQYVVTSSGILNRDTNGHTLLKMLTSVEALLQDSTGRSGPGRDSTTLAAAGLAQTGWIKTARI